MTEYGDKVIPLEEFGKKGTLTVYNQAYVEELEAKIAHLTRHLEPQSMSALFEQVEEEVKQEQKIKELEKESNHLFLEGAKRVEELEEKNAKLKEEIKYLSEQIQKLKIELDTPESVVLDKLDTAKAIIKQIIRVTWGEGWNYSLGVKSSAEKFLRRTINEFNIDKKFEPYQHHINDLEKENEELQQMYLGETYEKAKLVGQRNKAKEIIEKLISQKRKEWVYSDVREEAEQFLKECE